MEHPQVQPFETTNQASVQNMPPTNADKIDSETEVETRIEAESNNSKSGEGEVPKPVEEDYYDKIYNDLIGRGGDYNETVVVQPRG